jgi:hypothetical protein
LPAVGKHLPAAQQRFRLLSRALLLQIIILQLQLSTFWGPGEGFLMQNNADDLPASSFLSPDKGVGVPAKANEDPAGAFVIREKMQALPGKGHEEPD